MAVIGLLQVGLAKRNPTKIGEESASKCRVTPAANPAYILRSGAALYGKCKRGHGAVVDRPGKRR